MSESNKYPNNTQYLLGIPKKKTLIVLIPSVIYYFICLQLFSALQMLFVMPLLLASSCLFWILMAEKYGAKQNRIQ